jgi:hypothetical protein
LHQTALRLVGDELEGTLELVTRLVLVAAPAKQLPSDGMESVISIEVDAQHRFQPCASPFGLADGDRPIESHDRRAGQRPQTVVEMDDPNPVSVFP